VGGVEISKGEIPASPISKSYARWTWIPGVVLVEDGNIVTAKNIEQDVAA
jgi:hypothetical protein